MSTTTPLVVFITQTQTSCGYCVRFKESGQYDQLINKLKEMKIVEVVQLNTENNMGKKGGMYVHPGISKLPHIYPGFALCTYKNWKNTDTTFDPTIYGTEKVGTSWKWTNTAKIEVDEILKWVKEYVGSVQKNYSSNVIKGGKKAIDQIPYKNGTKINWKINYSNWTDGNESWIL